MSLTKRPCRRNRKAYVLLEEARDLKLHKVTHIKIGWVSSRVHWKMEINRCYHCLAFGHTAAYCREPDRNRSCWSCGEDGHAAGSCTRKPQSYTTCVKSHFSNKPKLGKLQCVKIFKKSLYEFHFQVELHKIKKCGDTKLFTTKRSANLNRNIFLLDVYFSFLFKEILLCSILKIFWILSETSWQKIPEILEFHRIFLIFSN